MRSTDRGLPVLGRLGDAVAAILGPLIGRRPPLLQVAALCCREDEVLLITSLDTGRWVIPKGWPMPGRSLAAAAQREAWEEAGVTGAVERLPIGRYRYGKRKGAGYAREVEVSVFRIAVRRMEPAFPEAGQRRLAWLPAAEAAALVDEPGLAAILRGCGAVALPKGPGAGKLGGVAAG